VAKRTLASLLKIFGVAAVDESVIQEALTQPSADFEARSLPPLRD
jgi:hypothetical protein